MTRSSSCPSVFALQRFAPTAEDPGGDIAAHVSSCSACQALAKEYEEWGAAYMSSPAARSLGLRLGELERARSRSNDASGRARWAWLGGLGAAAVLALVFMFPGSYPVERGGPEVEVLRPKGAVQLSLWVGDEGRVKSELDDAAVLRPGDRLQVVFGAAGKGFVALSVTTPAGQVIRVHPATGTWAAALEPGAPAPLGPSLRLDDEAGRYEVAVYFSEKNFQTLPLVEDRAATDAGSFPGLVLTRHFEVRR